MNSYQLYFSKCPVSKTACVARWQCSRAAVPLHRCPDNIGSLVCCSQNKVGSARAVQFCNRLRAASWMRFQTSRALSQFIPSFLRSDFCRLSPPDYFPAEQNYELEGRVYRTISKEHRLKAASSRYLCCPFRNSWPLRKTGGKIVRDDPDRQPFNSAGALIWERGSGRGFKFLGSAIRVHELTTCMLNVEEDRRLKPGIHFPRSCSLLPSKWCRPRIEHNGNSVKADLVPGWFSYVKRFWSWKYLCL